MKQFDNYRLEKFNYGQKLYVDFFLDFQNQDEEPEHITIGTPKCWDESFLSRIKIDNFDIYFLCTCFVPHNRVNRITEYKRIWGLCNLSQGIYENTYDIDKGKIYFGIVKSNGENGFKSNTSPIMLLVPKTQDFSIDRLFDCFIEEKYNFIDDLTQSFLMRINQIVPNSILLRYCVSPTISLSIYGKNMQNLFNEQDVLQWEHCDTVATYKGFLSFI